MIVEEKTTSQHICNLDSNALQKLKDAGITHNNNERLYSLLVENIHDSDRLIPAFIELHKNGITYKDNEELYHAAVNKIGHATTSEGSLIKSDLINKDKVMGMLSADFNSTQSHENNVTHELLKTKIKELKEHIELNSTVLTYAENWDVKLFQDTPVARALSLEEGMVEVPIKTKKASNSIISPKNLVVHLEKYDEYLSYIKLNTFIDLAKTNLRSLPDFVITMINKNNERRQFFIKDKKIVNLINNIKDLSIELGIAEYTITKYNIENLNKEVYPIFAWDFNWDDHNTYGLWYNKVNDPMLIECFQQTVMPILKKSEDGAVTILDVGGGKGRLAKKLIEEVVKFNISVNYILLEPSNQIEIARKNLKALEDNEKCKISFIKSLLKDIDKGIKAHCVISSGGPLNINVVSREQALSHLNIIKKTLLPQGVLIATGQTPLVVKAKHFNKVGLDVISYITPSITPPGYEQNNFIRKAEICGFFGNYQRYVCKLSENSYGLNQEEMLGTSTASL